MYLDWIQPGYSTKDIMEDTNFKNLQWAITYTKAKEDYETKKIRNLLKITQKTSRRNKAQKIIEKVADKVAAWLK